MPKKILLVEDDSLLSSIYKMKLEKTGFNVFIIEDGEMAVAKLNEINPDLVLLDLVLPRMDGISVCQKMRDKNQNVKIYFLTNISPEEKGDEAKEAGATGYIVKTSCTPSQLVDKVKTII